MQVFKIVDAVGKIASYVVCGHLDYDLHFN